MIEWWAQVTDTPDDSRIAVFSRGTFIGLKDIMEFGGHICPTSMFGLILLWKNAQKNEKKNNTSDEMNRIIPIFRPFTTKMGCIPCEEASREMSRHH